MQQSRSHRAQNGAGSGSRRFPLPLLSHLSVKAYLQYCAGDDGHGIVARDAPEHLRQAHRVDGRARSVGKARQRFEQHHDARAVHADAALIQNELQAPRVVDMVGPARNGVAAAAAAEGLLIKVELLDIARDGRLLALNAALGQARDELLLRLNVVLFDQFQDLLLSLAFQLSSSYRRIRTRRKGGRVPRKGRICGVLTGRRG